MRKLFFIVAAAVLVDTMFYAAVTPLLPTYRDELDLSKGAAGVLSASYAAGTLLASVPTGYLAARIGARRTLLVGMGLLAASSVAFAFANDIVLLDSARFLQGVGGACSWAGGLAWLVGATPVERRGELLGAAIGAAVAGVALGPVLGGAAAVTSPEIVFSLVGALAVAIGLVALATPGAPAPIPPTLSTVGAALRDRRVIAGAWLVALPALFSGTLNVLAPLRLDELGAGAVVVGGIFLLASIIEGLLSPVVGRISDRRGRLVPMRMGLAAAVPAGVLLPLAGTTVLEAVAVIAAVTALATFWSPAMALLSDAAEATGLDQGFAFALTNLAWAGGQVLGGAVGSRVGQQAGDGVPYAALCALCVATLVLVTRRSGRRAPAAAG